MEYKDESVTLRPARPEDEAFLYRVYASTREDELAAVPWDAVQKEDFLRMQFTAQDRYYREHFPVAAYQIVCHDARAVGRLYVDRRAEEIRIIDIALLPEHRSSGIGGGLLRALLDEAAGGNRPVRIHVEHRNPARRLYERLGFVPLEDKGLHTLMEWSPSQAMAK